MDDRADNIEGAARVGLRTLQFEGPDALARLRALVAEPVTAGQPGQFPSGPGGKLPDAILAERRLTLAIRRGGSRGVALALSIGQGMRPRQESTHEPICDGGWTRARGFCSWPGRPTRSGATPTTRARAGSRSTSSTSPPPYRDAAEWIGPVGIGKPEPERGPDPPRPSAGTRSSGSWPRRPGSCSTRPWRPPRCRASIQGASEPAQADHVRRGRAPQHDLAGHLEGRRRVLHRSVRLLDAATGPTATDPSAASMVQVAALEAEAGADLVGPLGVGRDRLGRIEGDLDHDQRRRARRPRAREAPRAAPRRRATEATWRMPAARASAAQSTVTAGSACPPEDS